VDNNSFCMQVFFVFRRENVQNLLSKLAGNYGGGRTVVASLTEMTWRDLCIVVKTRAVLTSEHTGHVPRAPGFFVWGPQLTVLKYIF